VERTSVFDTIKFRPGFCFFCFEQITVFQYFRDNSTTKDLKIPLFFLWMEIYWFSVLGEGCVLKWRSDTSLECLRPGSPQSVQLRPAWTNIIKWDFFSLMQRLWFITSLYKLVLKCTMVYDKDESGHAPDQPYMFEKSWLIANEMLSDG